MMKRTTLITLLALLALALPAGAEAKVGSGFFGSAAVEPTDADFAGMADTGFGVYRFELSWRVIQKTRKGGYDWAYVDARMAQTARAGMTPSVIVYGTPRFVSKSPDGFFPPTDSKRNLNEWRDFLKAAARRYGTDGTFWRDNPTLPKASVRQWIVWNEQNARAFWRPRPDPRDYAKLVEASDRALSAVDHKAQIVLGGMFGYPHDHRSKSAVEFLRQLYRVRGIAKHFDAINVHPYGSGVATVRKQVSQARKVARQAGDRGVDTLVGELGWASSGPSKSEEVVGAKGQAKRLKQGLELLVRNRRKWNVIGVYVYLWRDFSMPTSCLWCPGAGLVELDGTPKPARDSVRNVIRAST